MPALSQGLLVEHGTLGATVIDAGFRRPVFDKVIEGSAASRAGIHPGDRLLTFDDRTIKQCERLLNVLGTFPAGWPVAVTWEREGRKFSKEANLDRLPARLPPRIAGVFKADERVTREAAGAAASRPAGKPPKRTRPNAAIDRALACTVQLYGAAIGAEAGYGTGVIISPDGSRGDRSLPPAG